MKPDRELVISAKPLHLPPSIRIRTMPHLIQRYREKRNDKSEESQSPLMSLAETAGRALGDKTPSATLSTSGTAKASSLVTPSHTPANTSNKRSASEASIESKQGSDASAGNSSSGSGKGDSDDDVKTDTASTPITTSSDTPAPTMRSPVPGSGSGPSHGFYPSSGPSPWYSPNHSQSGYQYPPLPHTHMGMNMYHPHPYPPPYPWNPGMYYPHSPYPHHPGAGPGPGPHTPHMYPPPPYGYHNTGVAATLTPNQGDENGSIGASTADKSSNNTSNQEDDEKKEPDAKRVKTMSSSTPHSEPKPPFCTPQYPQTPRPMMQPAVPPPPHYYPPAYYPSHHPHVHPHAHSHAHPHTPLPPHVPSHFYNSHQQEENSKQGEDLKRCERINITKGNPDISPKSMRISGSPENGKSSPTELSTAEYLMPSFQSLVNFPNSIHRRMKSAVELRCVMCGEIRPSSHTKKDEHSHPHPNVVANPNHIIPKQNKGLCTACDVAVWLVKEDQVEIKWCKGCKNFKLWADFGEKPCATKCGKCREKQREKYAMKVGRDGGSVKKDRGAKDNEDSMTTKRSGNGLSFLIAATNQVSKV